MCGIVGYIGNRNSSKVIINGLKRLEYRGYDSAGIAFHLGNSIVTQKSAGKVIDLENLISCEGSNYESKLAMGHTRWATHGIPNIKNAHPHTDFSGKITFL